MFSMANVLSNSDRTAVVAALVEGNSIRATSRMTGVARNTVTKLLVDLAAVCAEFSSERLVGSRDAGSATELMQDLAGRLSGRVQITTDGLKAYISAVEDAFGGDVDYAQLVKIYGPAPEGERRYSPAECLGAEKHCVTGNPNPWHVSTSYVERQNLTMRMSMRRFTRLTNGHSKKVENHAAAIALYFMFYNFGRVHQTLRVTPAMEAGIADHVWSVEEIVGLLN